MLSAASAMDWTRRLFQSSMEQDGVLLLSFYTPRTHRTATGGRRFLVRISSELEC